MFPLIPPIYSRTYSHTQQLQTSLSRCLICGQPAHNKTPLCLPCQQRLQPLSGPLCRCSLPCPATEHGKLCGRCLKHPPAFSYSDCAWQYTFPLDRLINRYKHHGQLAIERLLIALWLQQLPNTTQHIDGLVPIPLHWRRYIKRGFNQAHRLANALSAHTSISVRNVLTQRHQGKLLQGMTAQQRRRHIKHRFKVTAPVKGLSLVLIDDVMTTGSTANEAARTLLAAGASQVAVWTFCRVLP